MTNACLGRSRKDEGRVTKNNRQLRDEIAHLTRHKVVQERDEQLFRYLSAVKVLSRQQIHRLLWSDSKEVSARKRLDKLMNEHHLLSNFHVPKAKMQARSLAYRKVYALTPLSRLWLAEKMKADPGRESKRPQTLHDLLVGEILTRMTEAVRTLGREAVSLPEDYRLTWQGENAASHYTWREDNHPRLMPDGLAILQKSEIIRAYFIEVDASREGHVRPSSRIGRKISGYDQYYRSKWRSRRPALAELAEFPAVLFITHGEKRLQNIANSILKLRRREVIYGLALFDDLFGADDFLTASAWLVIKGDSKRDGAVVAGREQNERQPLKAVGDALDEVAQTQARKKKKVGFAQKPVTGKKPQQKKTERPQTADRRPSQASAQATQRPPTVDRRPSSTPTKPGAASTPSQKNAPMQVSKPIAQPKPPVQPPKPDTAPTPAPPQKNAPAQASKHTAKPKPPKAMPTPSQQI